MLQIYTVLGTRPQIIKSAAISRAITGSGLPIQETILHTGQHYDANLCDDLISELELTIPHYNLAAKASNPSQQTAIILQQLAAICVENVPDAMLVFGDTTSTLAASLVASQLSIPLIHVEAGLRCYNKNTPEEINRIVCDATSTYLFAPTKVAYDQLLKEFPTANTTPKPSINSPLVHFVGDVMYDNVCHYLPTITRKLDIIEEYAIRKPFALLTIHRAQNTTTHEIKKVIQTLLPLLDTTCIVFPIHPRTLAAIRQLEPEFTSKFLQHANLVLIDPIQYKKMLYLQSQANIIITDSGGIQKEAFFLKKPCIVLRSETEWVELIENKNSVLCPLDAPTLLQQYTTLLAAQPTYPHYYGEGNAANKIIATIYEYLI